MKVQQRDKSLSLEVNFELSMNGVAEETADLGYTAPAL